jgi:predicted lipoprotein with Yx(FWY)xxD motif
LPSKSDISVMRRSDGRYQWAFRGRPLYQRSDTTTSATLTYASFAPADAATNGG